MTTTQQNTPADQRAYLAPCNKKYPSYNDYNDQGNGIHHRRSNSVAECGERRFPWQTGPANASSGDLPE